MGGGGGGGGGGSASVRFPVVYSPRRSTVMSGTDEYRLLTRRYVCTYTSSLSVSGHFAGLYGAQ